VLTPVPNISYRIKRRRAQLVDHDLLGEGLLAIPPVEQRCRSLSARIVERDAGRGVMLAQ